MSELFTQSENPSNQQRGFIRENELRQRVPVSRSTLWKWVREGKFPPPIKHSGVTMWRLADVDAWEDKQVAV